MKLSSLTVRIGAQVSHCSPVLQEREEMALLRQQLAAMEFERDCLLGALTGVGPKAV